MIKYENHCCDCAVPGYPCRGNSCPNMNVPIAYCDICSNNTKAQYEIDEEHYCEKHAKEHFEEIFKELTILEQAEVFDVKVKSLED